MGKLMAERTYETLGWLAPGFAGAFLLAACGTAPQSSQFAAPAQEMSAPSVPVETGVDFVLGTENQGGTAVDPNAFFSKDPPAKWCGPPERAPVVSSPGGTPQCPADKNVEGCPCTEAGTTASCWTGPRAQRNLGVCKDGQTTCMPSGEFGLRWGPCVGSVLPEPGATKGPKACKCFSEGEWALENVVPCIYQRTDAAEVVTVGINSAYMDGQTAKCNFDSKPVQDFTKNKLTVDCEGRFNLCFTVKAGDMDNPKDSDCAVMDPVCTGDVDYPKKGQVVDLPNLKSWESRTPEQRECAKKFRDGGGYGEMSVKGQSYLCDPVDDGNGNRLVFRRLKYCPFKCGQPGHESDAECRECRNGATGRF